MGAQKEWKRRLAAFYLSGKAARCRFHIVSVARACCFYSGMISMNRGGALSCYCLAEVVAAPHGITKLLRG